MNRIVFFIDGSILQVERGNRYLKKQIALMRRINGPVPYRFSGPFPSDAIFAYWRALRNEAAE